MACPHNTHQHTDRSETSRLSFAFSSQSCLSSRSSLRRKQSATRTTRRVHPSHYLVTGTNLIPQWHPISHISLNVAFAGALDSVTISWTGSLLGV